MNRDWQPDDGANPEDPGGVAGDFRAARPRAESPMTWSLPLCRLGGVHVRVHATMLLLAAVELLRSSVPGAARTLALPPTAIALGFLLLLCMLHEAARTVMARRFRGSLDEWQLWPLGGLVGIDPGDEPRRVLPEAAGFIAVAGLALLNGAALWWLCGRALEPALPAPWSLEGFRQLSVQGAGTLVETLWLLQWTAVVFLSLSLLPAAPLAGGRVLTAVLVERLGWSRGVRRSARAGTACAMLLLVAGLVWNAWTLTGLALVTWIAARETLLRVEAGDELLRDTAELPNHARRRTDEQAEIDRILEKINRHGMASLSFLERRRLKAATRRRRQGDGPIG